MKPLQRLVQLTPNLPLPPRTGGANKKSKTWESMGVRQKPSTCSMCAYSQIGTAFVPDQVPRTAQVAFVFAHPRQADVADQKPLSGSWGALMRKLLITDFGREETDVAFIHGIRCMPKKVVKKTGPAYDYPDGSLQRAAESNCRQYDDSSFKDGLLSADGLISWNPTLFLTTLDVDTMLEVGAYKFLVQADVRKAWAFADEGYRVAILFGTEVHNLVAGHLKGGSKRWRGSWHSGSWPFEAKIRKEGGFQ